LTHHNCRSVRGRHTATREPTRIANAT
jgi:hypothetical protein